VLTHHPDDYHGDHRDVSDLVFSASFAAANPLIEGRGDAPARVPALVYLDTLAGLHFESTEWVDITSRRSSSARCCPRTRANGADMRRAGYPLVLTQRWGLPTNSHQSGTLRFGADPATSVLDPMCRAHDVDNLYAVDGSFFPSVGGGPGGPTLTIAAQAVRVAAESGLAT
jgi:choline dehydrogenase-like flavoprotein